MRVIKWIYGWLIYIIIDRRCRYRANYFFLFAIWHPIIEFYERIIMFWYQFQNIFVRRK